MYEYHLLNKNKKKKILKHWKSNFELFPHLLLKCKIIWIRIRLRNNFWNNRDISNDIKFFETLCSWSLWICIYIYKYLILCNIRHLWIWLILKWDPVVTSRTGSARRILGILKKSVSWGELRTRHRTRRVDFRGSPEARQICALRTPHEMEGRWKKPE